MTQKLIQAYVILDLPWFLSSLEHYGTFLQNISLRIRQECIGASDDFVKEFIQMAGQCMRQLTATKMEEMGFVPSRA